MLSSIDSSSRLDDVFTTGPSASLVPTDVVEQIKSVLDAQHVPVVDDDGVRNGPYLTCDRGLLPVRKLVPDTQGAFVTSLVQDLTSHRFVPSVRVPCSSVCHLP